MRCRRAASLVRFGRITMRVAGLLAVACAVPLAKAATAPADPCSLLSAAQVSSAMGKTFSAPEKSVAPRPFANTVQGQIVSIQAVERVFCSGSSFDPSPKAATDLFAKLKMFYSPPTPVPGLGDEAYFDPHHGIHVRKGNVRFFLSPGKNEKRLTNLATLVAGQL